MPKINAEALRALVFANGFTVNGFAVEIEISPSHLSNILAGRRGAPAPVIKKMAETLKVPVAALVNGPVGATS